MQSERRPIVGRPASLDSQQIECVYLYVSDKYRKSAAPNIHHLIDFVFNKFNVSIKSRTLKELLFRSARFKSVIERPLESTRAEVELQTILEYYDRLDSFLRSDCIPPQFF